jgi:hypothetical protein
VWASDGECWWAVLWGVGGRVWTGDLVIWVHGCMGVWVRGWAYVRVSVACVGWGLGGVLSGLGVRVGVWWVSGGWVGGRVGAHMELVVHSKGCMGGCMWQRVERTCAECSC